MLLILTHENSDFDAVASLWAAHRLHPEGIPLLARRVNRNVLQFLTLYWGAFKFRRQEDWRRQKVDEVLLVDTHALPSVRGLRAQTQVRVVDHHENREPKEGWRYHTEAVGATTTLLVEMIQGAGLKLTREEATLFLLGIYEDTGTLTYDTTDPRDVRAAAWLLEHGANLPTVRRFMEIPLTADQQQLYERLLAAGEWHSVAGQSLLVAAAQGPENFEDEISSVVGRLRDALLPPAMFVLVALPHRVHLVARSNEDGVDVSIIAKVFGGGGHSRAAAATIHDATLQAVQSRLMDLLREKVEPIPRVSDLMSHHVKTIRSGESAAAAAAEMQRYGHEGYPVVDAGERLVGLLSRRAVDRAINHELGHLPVSQIMRAGQVTVRPSDPISHLQQIMVEEGWGQVPVVAENDAGRLIGIVTRTDLLQQLMRREKRPARPNLRERLEKAFDPPLWALIRSISAAAAGLQLPIYFVGGLVRDVMLGKRAVDIDIVAEGDSIQLVEWLVDRYGGKLHTHARFGTAKWILVEAVWNRVGSGQEEGGSPDGGGLNHRSVVEAIDFVTARTEFYEEPTVLPTVIRGSIKLDLLRRDFTINTLAIRLDGAHLGELLDFYGGLRDLEQGAIRVLHSLSFIDDPTRILRAVRFEQRLNFEIEARTLELLENSVELLPRVTGARLWNELSQGFAEANPGAVMSRFDQLGVLSQIHPDVGWSDRLAIAFARLPDLLARPEWRAALPREGEAGVYLLLWLGSHRPAVARVVVNRLRLSRDLATTTRLVPEVLAGLRRLEGGVRPSRVEKLLRPHADYPAALLAARVLLDGEPAAQLLDSYWQEWRHVRTAVSGHDLRALDLPPGPRYATILDRVLAARLDGEVTGEAAERSLMEKLVAEEHAGSGPG